MNNLCPGSNKAFDPYLDVQTRDLGHREIRCPHCWRWLRPCSLKNVSFDFFPRHKAVRA